SLKPTSKDDDSRTLAQWVTQAVGSTNLAVMETAWSSRLVMSGTVVDEALKVVDGHGGGRCGGVGGVQR
ncbi:hypothetical protein U1Q18_027378, partial [Sarracenia purpurea var. burkii]